mmetsp:Transcript_81479/g.236249  ORF Transcript_81479/g.236249 Transcript_81479/m.236249 type:complete len:468 (+) Transcript_81479:150-1553(+)
MRSPNFAAAVVVTMGAAAAEFLPSAMAFQAAPLSLLTRGSLDSATRPTSLFSTMSYALDVSETAARDVPTFDEWATSCGVQRCGGFQLTPSGNEWDPSDISVMTTGNIPANSPILYVPGEMIFSSKNTEAELGPFAQDAADMIRMSLYATKEAPYFYLMLKILVEYERGYDSPWFPWLNSLPRYYSNGASMTPKCYECLPPLVRSMAQQERANWRTLYGAVDLVPFLSDETKRNKELCKWAFQIAYTRSFEVPSGTEGIKGDLRIVPMADYFNHGSAETEVELMYDEQGNCYAQSTRDIPAGSPLRMSYGDPTNPSFLLARYGFLDEEAPATFCKIMIARPDNQVKQMGYKHNRMLFYKDSGEASEEVFDVLLYLGLSQGGNLDLQKLVRAHAEVDSQTKMALHQQYWPQTAQALYEHIEGFLQQLEELSAVAQSMDINSHPRLPLIQKHNEFVKESFMRVRARYFS